MTKKYSFKETMTGMKKCPGCGQREISLDNDFCDVCSGEGSKKIVSEKKEPMGVLRSRSSISSGDIWSWIGDWWGWIIILVVVPSSFIFGHGTIMVILSIIAIPLILGFFIWLIWLRFFTPEERERRKIEREEREQFTQMERKREQQQKELNLRIAEEAEMNQYRQLRKEIEAMPEHRRWKQDVFEKFGRECAIGGPDCDSAVEVDHRYKSFYSIVREYGITNTVQAYECAALWAVDNGAPLCKIHHDQTKSSLYYKEKKN